MELTQKCDEYESESLNQFLNINKCKTVQNLTEKSPSAVSNASSAPLVSLSFSWTSRGHSSCCLSKRLGFLLVVVPGFVRHRLFISHEIIIPAGSRYCPNHIQRNIENVDLTSTTTTLNRYLITQLIRFLLSEALRNENVRPNFESQSHLQD